MRHVHVLRGAAAIAAGIGLLSGGGATYGLGADAAGSAAISSGTVGVEATGLVVAVNGQSAGHPVVVPGDTLTFTTTATVTVTGGLEATLHLDSGELFAQAPAPVREALAAGTAVELTGLPPVAGRDDAWTATSRAEPYAVTAVITATVPEAVDMGEPLTTGTLTWSVQQAPTS